MIPDTANKDSTLVQTIETANKFVAPEHPDSPSRYGFFLVTFVRDRPLPAYSGDMKSLVCIFLFLLIGCTSLRAQDHEAMIQKIFEHELAKGESWTMLEYLTKKIGARLSGSPQAAAAVEYTRQTMKIFSDSVWLQPVMVPHWVRGEQESAVIISQKYGTSPVSICALGGSVATPAGGLTSRVVEVRSFDDLQKLGRAAIAGKIVFFNRPFKSGLINTFSAYSGAVDQRATGASEAARYGAIGVIVRSMASGIEDYPHTGGMNYANDAPRIPAVAISTAHAELLSSQLYHDRDLQLHFETHCRTLEDAPSFNVIGELRGKELPDEIIVVSGHLDSWDLGEGAHDDGAGCVQAMEVLRIFRSIGYRPRRTIRAVMYMNEENGLRGGIEYANQARLKAEKHIAAMESDRGGFTPRGFSITASEAVRNKIQSWRTYLSPFGLTDFEQRGGGADIGPLGELGVPLIGYLPDSQRYFRYHHSREDTLDKVDRRELELGAAAMAALIYLIDQQGL